MGTWSDNKKAINKLVQGRDSTTQLRTLLRKPLGEHGLVSVEELAEKILTSFNETISLLTSTTNSNSQCNSDHDHDGTLNGGDVISGGEINAPELLDHHSHCDDRSSEDSGGSSKKRSPPPDFKDRRGCYKRRKSSQSWTTVMPTIEDGQAWRKYGQKEILNAKYPRAYFRCTRKHEQGCRATKQVQQIQDNPKMYQTTYIGQHTCKHILKAPQMILDNSEPYNHLGSLVNNNYKPNIGFDHHSSNSNKNSSAIVPDNNAPTLMEQEQVLVIKEEAQVSEDLSDKSSFDTEFLWSDFKDIELSDPSMGLLSPSSKRVIGTDNDQDAVDSITFSFVDRISMDIDFRDFDEAEFPLGSA